MRLPLRSPLVVAVPLLLMFSVAGGTAGCSAGAGDSGASGATVTATGSAESTSGSTDEPTDEPTDDPGEPTSTTTELPAAVAAVCTPYAEMVRAIQDVVSSSTDPDAVAAEIGPVMKEFAARVPDLERPPGVSAATWHGVQALAARILELPDEPTNAEIEAVEDQLSPTERVAVEEAAAWLRSHCRP